jgi:leader peptidase (prepilin peptidase)/N-methyltransferase
MSWIDLLTQSPPLLYGFTALFGLAVGSFLNVVIHRLPRMIEEDWRRECDEDNRDRADDPVPKQLTLLYPGSHCPRCGHRLRPSENIPLLSYLILRGRCASCGSSIGLRYPAVELFTALLSVLVVWRFGLDWATAGALVVTWALVALSLIDFETQLLPDTITLPLLWLGLLCSLGGWFTDSQSAIVGATLGYVSLWSVFQVFRLVTGKEGMGYGDFKLLALFGAWLGWQHLPQIILISACTGALVGGFLIIARGHDRRVPIPFGPYLATAGWISLMWGDTINEGYLQWAGLR